MVELKQITKDNIDAVLALKTAPGQKEFVSTTAESLAQAYVYRETAFPFAVYDDGVPVGFIMMGYYERKSYYTLWKLMIDEKYQNRGYGRKALELGVSYIKDRFCAKEIYTGVVPGNEAAKHLYKSAGFVETGTVEDNMEEMRLII